MKVDRIYLKDRFGELGKDGANAYVDCYIPGIMEDMELEYTYRPCMVICPGGGYEHVSGREAEPVALNFLNDGYCVFVLHYSVAPYAFPQQLLEVAGSLELIHENSEKWMCDKNNIAIMGFSAGGHLAAQYTNRYDCEEVRKVFANSKPVHKNILCYPVISDDARIVHQGCIINYLGYKPQKHNENGVSCECLVTEMTPPTFIWHTAEDRVVSVGNSLAYGKALSEKGVSFEMHIYPYGSHGLSTVDNHTCVGISEKTRICHQWLQECKRWLRM